MEQIISRENPALDLMPAQMAVGRDGLVYLSNMDRLGMGNPGYVLRMTRDGAQPFDGAPGAAVTFVTANAAGKIAASNAHFVHAVSLFDSALKAETAFTDFDPGNRYYAPNHVEAGASGDFYGLDQNKDRIVRINSAGKVIQSYSYPRQPAGPQGEVNDFRVDEATSSFFVQSGRYSPVRKIGFDGTVKWSSPPVASGGFDVDDAGVLYAIVANGDTVTRFAPDGKPAGEIELQLGEPQASLDKYQINNLRVFGNDVLLKRKHPTEMFLRFDRTSGALQKRVNARYERLAVTYPSDTWAAGAAVPFGISFDNPLLAAAPHWRVWARNVGAMNWREFKVSGGNVQVPADAAGIFQVKVSPEVFPWQRGAASEYRVQGWVEVRAPGSKGSLSVLTANNRSQYGRGEAIPFQVLVRGGKELEGKKFPVTVELLGENGAAAKALVSSRISTSVGQNVAFTVGAATVAGLRLGRYSLRATAPGMTAVAQPIELGAGLPQTDFRTIYYGDYTQGFWPVGADAWSATDLSVAAAERMRKLGVNLVVERLNFNPDALTLPGDAVLRARLEGDATAVAPEKLATAHPLLQTLGATGARGTQQMGILLGNDQGLPLGSDYGMPRADAATTEAKKAIWAANLTKATKAVQEYPAFRGWSWAANWWLTTPAEEPVTAEGKAAYKAAVERAYKTGKWEPILDQVADINLGFAPQATEFFNKALRGFNKTAVTAVAAPYRNGQAYPPVSFQNVDEVDLQAQWEQMAPPAYAPHNVDFYKRPGKPALGHPELWNDSGTGDQILPTLFQMTMRGANGVGFANELPQWAAEDSRSAQPGTASIYRALNGTLAPLGPWLNTTQNDDRVAIVVSGRMMKLDGWKLNSFWGNFEAYITCLHAHHPASIVFAEDMKPDSLARYSAVLVVGQKVDFEPPLAAALKAAKTAGVAIFADGTCRPELVKEFKPLGISFNKVVDDWGMGVGGDEATYARMPKYIRANLPAVLKALNGAAVPAATIQNDEVWASVRKAEQGRYLFVVNNSTVELGPEELWRVNLFGAVRVPVETAVKLNGKAGAVYDVFDLKQVTPKQGVVTADLRTLPMRVFALLPAAIGKVALRGPQSAVAGQSFKWWAQVRDAADKPIAAGVPLRVRLLAGDGTVVEERFVAAGSRGVSGEMVLPVNLPAGVPTLEATELFSGKSAQLKVGVKAGTPVSFEAAARPVARPAAAATGAHSAGTALAASRDYGPHLRDMALSGDGKTALINAMNWDENAYALDTTTGAVRWKKRVGQYFAFAPQATAGGFAVQGFDFGTPEGYHLYLANGAGQLERRFALYGVPPRAPFRMYASSFHDHINNFATAPDASWVASAGDLGVAVWDRAGKLLWSRDDWKARRGSRANEKSDWLSTMPVAATLLALNADTLVLADGMTVSARNARSGAVLWKVTLANTGEVRKLRLSADGVTIGAMGTAEGGVLYILRDGKLVQGLPFADGYDFEISPDGKNVALLAGNQLRLYGTEGGLRWLYPADDRLRFARFSADGKRIATSSDLGTLTVLGADGAVLHERDTRALAVPAWLPNGDLLLANWMGTVVRLDARYRQLWRAHLQPATKDMRGRLRDKDGTPTVRVAAWGNAEAEPWPLTPNLLAETKATINFPNVEKPLGNNNDISVLTDGKPDAPKEEWLWPGEVNQWSGLRFFNTVRMDMKKPVRVTGMTFVEDAKNPSSWLRDADVEYWDAKTEQWVFVMNVLSNSAVHTHKFPRAVETSKLRIILPFALYGNLRWGELVVHGTAE